MKTISLPVLNSPLVEKQKDNKTTKITGYSVFNDIEYSIEDYNGLFITDRIEAQNFRHRMSEPGYFSTWHVAGDATLIIVRSGTLRMTLRNGDYRDFSAGDMFVAQDYLQDNETFNNEVHGHTAELIGDEPLFAVHIKLATRVV
ncbi:hypothetical protein WNY51_05525 [Pseudocolwellia sp. AS88]|uniref:hypothetical protein n=1 Tax=Pseudocolwellia sp. AS88 TaxID=3063958 RepID=UPI0026EFDD46|nr:hypothetical protein [Pseudocolwellia sp. AS88]MDO7083452.1 hypothetical protein [Pseudocolwellia sp. AS88]